MLSKLHNYKNIQHNMDFFVYMFYFYRVKKFHTNFLSRDNPILFYFLFCWMKNKVYFSMSIKHTITVEIFNAVPLKAQTLKVWCPERH